MCSWFSNETLVEHNLERNEKSPKPDRSLAEWEGRGSLVYADYCFGQGRPGASGNVQLRKTRTSRHSTNVPDVLPEGPFTSCELALMTMKLGRTLQG